MDNDIVPAKRIGMYHIGWTYDRLVEHLSEGFEQRELELHITLQTNVIKLWVSKATRMVTQILVFDRFEGKFLNKIGIGNCLEDVTQLGIEYRQNDYVYELPDFPGICFELEDIDEWDELTAPIKYISIYEI
ncbi:hypothetical protein [Paenibacillus sp. S150]|uniref:hypothetical protein n=1 Tax=Paenibacillus sp. S150 TaxID=2749826 RepID=UPI001C563B57|nr:hypothetical protein [Paenibacillus sp. S150]MBW4082941.1 hypothetical protein [Paenibacillus sp. S150]